jgi:hypothetical protein
LPRSRNSNREVWESPYLQVGVDVKSGEEVPQTLEMS